MVTAPPSVPRASGEPLPDLAAFLRPFAPLFRNRQSRHRVARSLTGLPTGPPRKHCQAIAAAVAGTSTERLPHLLTDAAWDPRALDRARVQAAPQCAESGRRHLGPRRYRPAQAGAGLGRGGAPVLGHAGQTGPRTVRWWSAPHTSRMPRRRRRHCPGR